MTDSLRVALLLDPLAFSLDAHGLRVKWASHAPELAKEFLGRGYHVRGFGAPPGLIPRSTPDDGPEEAYALGGKLRQFAPDLIVAYDTLSPAALRGARMARSLGATLVLVEGGWGGHLRWKERALRRCGHLLWGPYVRRTAAAVVALDPRAETQALGDGFERELVRIVPHGVDVQAYRPGLSSTVVARQRIRGRILLYLGKLADERGVMELLAAFARSVGQRSDWNMLFAGDGPARAELRAMGDRLGIADRVHWAEPREEELPGLLGASTVLAIPALSDEVVGRYGARALACGLPILASDLPNLRAFVEPDVNGALVAPGSIEAWAAAIQQLASAPTTRARWARESRRLAIERYSWPAVATRFEALFHDAREHVRAKLERRTTRGGAYAGR
ncbi:MAG: glycosyltransferase [Planctomycetes bacterium]|nr:glycosyltransferase [Planctomycetota bacterium]